jgi:hypothetical protein
MRRVTMKRVLVVLGALGALLFSSGASAQEKKGGNVITIGEVTIVGRVQKPVASVDVSKIQPKLTLAELRQPFLDRIEEATHHDPF